MTETRTYRFDSESAANEFFGQLIPVVLRLPAENGVRTIQTKQINRTVTVTSSKSAIAELDVFAATIEGFKTIVRPKP